MSERIAIIGGGIAGLATAYYLQRSGYTPVILEASKDLGGLGSDFSHEGVPIERFYHVMINSDVHLIELLDELNLTDRMHWQQTGMGFYVNGKLYPFNTPMDLLRFGGLNPFDRIRTGAAALALSKRSNGEDLDQIPVGDFLKRQFGQRAFQQIWEPLLRAKFGDLYSRVPAYWFWSRMRREKNGAPEVKGHIRGGYREITRALETVITQQGGFVRRQSPVQAIRQDSFGVRVTTHGHSEYFDAVVSTLPLPLLRLIAEGPLEDAVPNPDLVYQGVVNAVVVAKQPLQPFYWNAVLDSRFPFQGVVETTKVIPTQWTKGRHILYLMNYCQPDSAPYNKPDEQIKREAGNGLTSLYPNFKAESVEATYVFRAPHVEPVWPLGYLRNRPAVRLRDSHVFQCTTAQAYPMVNSWNTSVGLAKQTVSEVVRAMTAAPKARFAVNV